jgi:putative membrane protein
MAADPDTRARTHMANERTFLAWFRTGLTLVALGLAAEQFLGQSNADSRLVTGLATISILTGAFIVLVGGNRYWSGRTRIEEETFRPASVSIIVTTIGAVAMAILAIGFVLILGTRS